MLKMFHFNNLILIFTCIIEFFQSKYGMIYVTQLYNEMYKENQLIINYLPWSSLMSTHILPNWYRTFVAVKSRSTYTMYNQCLASLRSVSTTPTCVEVCLIQPYVIKLVSDLRKICGFFFSCKCTLVFSINKTNSHNITKLLL